MSIEVQNNNASRETLLTEHRHRHGGVVQSAKTAAPPPTCVVKSAEGVQHRCALRQGEASTFDGSAAGEANCQKQFLSDDFGRLSRKNPRQDFRPRKAIEVFVGVDQS